MANAIYRQIFKAESTMKKEDTKMKDTTYTKKLAYMGAGCGMVLFAIFGLTSRVVSWRSDGIKYGRHTVWHTGRGRIGPEDDRGSLDGGRGHGIRDDVHHGIYDTWAG